MTHLKNSWWLLIALLLIGLALVSFAEAINCNDVLGPGGTFALEADLTCETAVGLTVIGPAVLDLQGHSITMVLSTLAPSPVAIALDGRGARVRNGSVVEAWPFGIYVGGEGGHHVSTIDMPYFMLAQAGIQVDSDNNWIVNNFSQSRGFGIVVAGDGNRILGNAVYGQVGLFVEGDYNVMAGNVGHYEHADIVDVHEDCAHNVWRFNEFDSSRAGDVRYTEGIPNPPCIGESVDLPDWLATPPLES